MIRAKICGNRNIKEAHIAVHCGADAIGILVGPHTETQKHFVETETARDIIASLPPFVHGVIVTTYTTEDEIASVLSETGASVVQCHGQVSRETIAALRVRFPTVSFIAVVHVRGAESMKEAQAYATVAHALLLDTAHRGVVGGTGMTHDWNMSAAIIQAVTVPIILAGGLTPENVREAITTTHPYAVDVRSGVSLGNGDKDVEKMQTFIRHAHAL